MAGIKRRLEETQSLKVKRSKSYQSTQNRKLVGRGKLHDVKKPTFPSSEHSKVEQDDISSTFGTENLVGDSDEDGHSAQDAKNKKPHAKTSAAAAPVVGGQNFTNGSSSRESHVKQKALAQERRAAKPHADSIARSKKIWERLRRKSHVPLDERKALVVELFQIISGRVKDFVFKHDCVRVIQTAIKYANITQKRQIANELKGEYRALAESRYAKFLIAKLVVGDEEIRDIVIPEFYGHVKRLIRHPESAWLLDDLYRTIATSEQKQRLLREWYGHEFVIFRDSGDGPPMAELSAILAIQPEKKGPIMQHLKEMTNQLMQKKTSGFTMLHDALLEYFINCSAGGTAAMELIQVLKDDEDGDCLKNLAFTKSGARLVCLALAHGNAKDRRAILRAYKGVIKMLAADIHGHRILLTCFDVIDDTVMTAKIIFPELLSKQLDEQQRRLELLSQIEHLTARISLLYLLSSGLPKWLLPPQDIAILQEVHQISKTTSKKDPQARREELAKAMSEPLIDMVVHQTEPLVLSSFGCQFITEVLFGAIGDKTAAVESLASLASDQAETVKTPHARRMMKSLVQGGPFDKDKQKVRVVEPPLRFEDVLYARCRGALVDWASGVNSFVVVAMLESARLEKHDELARTLQENLQVLEEAVQGSDTEKSNSGTRILLQKIVN